MLRKLHSLQALQHYVTMQRGKLMRLENWKKCREGRSYREVSPTISSVLDSYRWYFIWADVIWTDILKKAIQKEKSNDGRTVTPQFPSRVVTRHPANQLIPLNFVPLSCLALSCYILYLSCLALCYLTKTLLPELAENSPILIFPSDFPACIKFTTHGWIICYPSATNYLQAVRNEWCGYKFCESLLYKIQYSLCC